MTDSWNPQQYHKFQAERSRPFFDLLDLVLLRPEMNVIDLGCGTGELTASLHQKTGARKTLGIDSSPAMLQKAMEQRVPNLEFQLVKIEEFQSSEKYDLVLSNAALQWVPDHNQLFETMFQLLAKNGQLAIQMPCNFDFPTHSIAKELSLEMPFKPYLGGGREPSVLPLESYSQLLWVLGAKEQHARIQVYGHLLESTENVIEWVKGSLLTYYQSRLPKEVFDEFLIRYRAKVLAFFGAKSPFFLPFKRLLLWGKI